MAALRGLRFWRRLRGRRNPLCHELLRSPGQSLLGRLDALNEEIQVSLASFMMFPLFLYATHVSQSHFGGVPESYLRWFTVAGVGLLFNGYLLCKIIRLLEQRRIVRLGYEGELAVGQELNQLMIDGCRVYHDFPGEKFNIDHIIVGRAGIFAVETKTRSKPTTHNRRLDATVVYDGKVLNFPTGKDRSSLEQARRQSQWLTRWLANAVGEPLKVTPILALPGWFVERTGPGGIPVINPRQIKSLLRSGKTPCLSDGLITRVAHQLAQRCRDVAPKAGGEGN
jgi:hypothetical protein